MVMDPRSEPDHKGLEGYILADYKAALKKLAESEKYNRERNKQKRGG